MSIRADVIARVEDENEGAEIVTLEAPAPRPEGLPEGAELQADGSVLLTLRYPDMAVLRTRRQGEEAREERFERIVLRRLTGKDLRDSMRAAEGEDLLVLFAGASRLGLLKARTLYDSMDATDCIAVGQVLRFLSTPGGPGST